MSTFLKKKQQDLSCLIVFNKVKTNDFAKLFRDDS